MEELVTVNCRGTRAAFLGAAHISTRLFLCQLTRHCLLLPGRARSLAVSIPEQSWGRRRNPIFTMPSCFIPAPHFSCAFCLLVLPSFRDLGYGGWGGRQPRALRTTARTVEGVSLLHNRLNLETSTSGSRSQL